MQKLTAIIEPIYFSGSSSLWMIMLSLVLLFISIKFKNWTVHEKKIWNFEYKSAKVKEIMQLPR